MVLALQKNDSRFLSQDECEPTVIYSNSHHSINNGFSRITPDFEKEGKYTSCIVRTYVPMGAARKYKNVRS